MSVLEAIVAHKRVEVAAAQVMRPLAAVRGDALAAPPPRDFAGALRAAAGFAVIAEIKHASPAAGPIRDGGSAAETARHYARGGASALSVLTDWRFFRGAADDLRQARAAVPLPVLRKDFVLEPYQVYESRALGADAVLLIAAVLGGPVLARLVRLVHDLRMAALVEVHAEDEVERALAAGARLIGINNRDLHTLEVDLDTTRRLRARIPRGILVVSESGITTAADVARVRPHADAVLVGTAVMRSDDPAATLRALMNGGNGR